MWSSVEAESMMDDPGQGHEVVAMVQLDVAPDGSFITSPVVRGIMAFEQEGIIEEVVTSEDSISAAGEVVLTDSVILEADEYLEGHEAFEDMSSTSQSTFVLSSNLPKSQTEYVAMKPGVPLMNTPDLLNNVGDIGEVIMEGDGEMIVEQSVEVVEDIDDQLKDYAGSGGEIILIPSTDIKGEIIEEAEVVVSNGLLKPKRKMIKTAKGRKVTSARTKGRGGTQAAGKKRRGNNIVTEATFFSNISPERKKSTKKSVANSNNSINIRKPTYLSSYQQRSYTTSLDRMTIKRPELLSVEVDDSDMGVLLVDTRQASLQHHHQSLMFNTPDEEDEEEEDSYSSEASLGSFECSRCSSGFKSQAELQKHTKRLHNSEDPEPADIVSQTYTCTVPGCGFRTQHRGKLDRHLAKHAREGETAARKRDTTALVRKMRYETEEYQCPVCPYTCTVEKAFRKHQRQHKMEAKVQTGVVKISCVVCGKDRPSDIEMKRHMRKHCSGKYYCCDMCTSFKTIQLSKLIQHRRIHTGEKPHLCPHCPYRSARRDNLRAHVRSVHKQANVYFDSFQPKCAILAQVQCQDDGLHDK